MVVYITEHVFSEAKHNQAVARELRLLFYLFERNQHQWLMPRYDPSICFTPALAGYHEWMEKVMVESVKVPESATNIQTVIVRVSTLSDLGRACRHYGANESLKVVQRLDGQRLSVASSQGRHEWIDIDLVNPFLSQPLHVVLENLRSDRRFVEVVFHLITERQLNDPRIVDIVHGGGNELHKWLEDAGGRKRTVCIVDGDTYAPGKTKPDKVATKERIRGICESLGYGVHILERHEIENYLSDQSIRLYRKSTGNDQDHPFYFFDPTTKRFFDMKDGWTPAQQLAVIPAEVATELAAGGEATHIPGFGPNIWKAWDFVSTKEELLAGDPEGELLSLVHMINEWL